MFLDIKKPYLKALKDVQNRVRYIAYTEIDGAMLDYNNIGELLIQFIFADLESYKEQADVMVATSNGIVSSENDEFSLMLIEFSMYGVADMLKDIFPIGGFYLRNKLNQIFKSDKKQLEKLTLASSFLKNIVVLQEIFKNGVLMCCDVDFDKPLSSVTASFLAFTALHPDFSDYKLVTGVGVAPIKNGKLDFDIQEELGTNMDRNIQRSVEILQKLDEKNKDIAHITEFVLLKDFEDFLYFEFTELIKRGLRVRECRNCGKYFVLQSKHETLYCDRENADGKTCKEIGNKQKHMNKVSSDPLLKRCKQVYKSSHARMERSVDKEFDLDVADGIRDSFNDWSKALQKARVDYESGSMSVDDFKAFIEEKRWQP